MCAWIRQMLAMLRGLRLTACANQQDQDREPFKVVNDIYVRYLLRNTIPN